MVKRYVLKIRTLFIGLILSISLAGCYISAWNVKKLDHWAERELPDSLMQQIPDFSERQEIRILVFGDSGKPESFVKVAGWMAQACENSCDLALMLGDNFYFRGPSKAAPEEFQTHFKAPLSGHGDHLASLNYWSVLGNHGYVSLLGRPPSDPMVQLEYTYQQPADDHPLWLMPAQQYVIPKLPGWLTVVGVDTFFVADRRSFDGSDEEYQAARSKYLLRVHDSLGSKGDDGWRVIFGHHPKMTIGDHADENQMTPVQKPFHDLVPIINFSGHDHDQQLIETSEVVQIIQGAASKTRADSWGGARAEEYFDGTLQPAYKRLGLGATAEYCDKLGFAIATFREREFELTFYWGDANSSQAYGSKSWNWTRNAQGQIARSSPPEPGVFKDLCPDSS